MPKEINVTLKREDSCALKLCVHQFTVYQFVCDLLIFSVVFQVNSTRPSDTYTWTWTWTWKKCLLDKKQIQAGNNVINDTYRVFYVGRRLQRRWAHRWRKSDPNILQCMNRHRAHEVLTFWEHEFGICNQNESTPLGKAPSRHTRGTQLT